MSKFTQLFTAAIVAALALGGFAKQANAESLAEIIAAKNIDVSNNRPLVLEDDNWNAVIGTDGNTTTALVSGNYIITVAEFAFLTRNSSTIDNIPFSFDATTGTTTGLVPVTPKATLGPDGPYTTSVQAILFGVITDTNLTAGPNGANGTIEIGAASVDSLGGLLTGLNLSGFSDGVMAQVYLEEDADDSDFIQGQSISADVNNVAEGELIATFGKQGESGEFYTLLVRDGVIVDFGLSLSLFLNNTGLPILENNLGTELFAEGGDFSPLPGSEWQSFGDGNAGIVVIPTPAALPAGLGLLALATLRRRRNG